MEDQTDPYSGYTILACMVWCLVQGLGCCDFLCNWAFKYETVCLIFSRCLWIFFFSTTTEWSLSATDTTTKLYATWYVMMSSVCMSVWHHVALVLATFIGKQLATLQTWNKKTCPDKIKCLCSVSQWNLFSSPAECFLLRSSFQCPLLFLFESKI